MISGPKYITKKNIPLPLAFNEEPEFCIALIEERNDDLILHYQIEGRGFSIHTTDVREFNQLPDKYEMISGGWYGNKGRWSPLERYTGSIICKNISHFKQIDEDGEDYSFTVKKKWFSDTKKLRVESESLGTVNIECASIEPQEYTVEIYRKDVKTWVLRSSELSKTKK